MTLPTPSVGYPKGLRVLAALLACQALVSCAPVQLDEQVLAERIMHLYEQDAGPVLMLASTGGEEATAARRAGAGDVPKAKDRRRAPVKPAAGETPTGPLRPGQLPPALLSTVPADKRPAGPWRVGKIHIEPQRIFEKAVNFVYQTLNLLHVTTHADVIAQEVLPRTGELYDAGKVDETERNLRQLHYLAGAEILAAPQPDGTVDLHVRSRDKFTLTAGLQAKYVGGVARFGAEVGESNLFSRGKRLRMTYRYEDDGQLEAPQGVFTGIYQDPRLFGSRWTLGLERAKGNNGSDAIFRLRRPFFSSETPWAAQFEARRLDHKARYYSGGALAAEVPRRVERLFASSAISSGKRYDTRRLHLDLERTRTTYGDAVFHDPSFALAIPGRTVMHSALLRAEVTRHARHLEIRGLDGVDHVEDVPLGWSGELSAGLGRREEAGTGAEHPVLLGASVSRVFQPHRQHLTSVRLRTEAHVRGGEVPRLVGSAFVHHYYRGLKGQVLALSLAGATVFEGRDLPLQLTLGEDNGLRGYTARAFAGERRLRINLEDRIRTPVEFLSVKMGVVAFFDAGMVWGRGESPSGAAWLTSVGLGLRFGSSALAGRKIVRLDLAIPLNPQDDNEFTVSVSATMGQVFSLFENAEELKREI